MKKIEIGDQISNVVVTALIPFEEGSRRDRKYLCTCKCGKETFKWGSSLRDGRRGKYALSCRECNYKNQSESKRQFDFLKPGDVFGLWTVVGLSERKDSRRKIMYDTVCACGTKSQHALATLAKGRSGGCLSCRSMPPCLICGCYNHMNAIETIECEHLGFCPTCDRYEIRDDIDVAKLTRALVGKKSKATSKRRFRVSKNR